MELLSLPLFYHVYSPKFYLVYSTPDNLPLIFSGKLDSSVRIYTDIDYPLDFNEDSRYVFLYKKSEIDSLKYVIIEYNENPSSVQKNDNEFR